MDHLAVQLEQLENPKLVRRVPDEDLSYLFKHALTQEAAYESLLKKKRREIHEVVARAYEQVYPDHLDENAALLEEHYAEAGDDEKTFAYAVCAGDAAARARVAWSRVMAQRGNMQAARAQLGQAAAQFQVSGLVNELDEVKCLIQTLEG